MTKNYLRFWGVRGSYPAPFDTHYGVGGNTSCVEVRVDDHIVICDAGTGVIPLGNDLMKQQDIREITVLLTHYQWDHISGLPFFVPAFVPGWKINFFGPGETNAEIATHLSDHDPNYDDGAVEKLHEHAAQIIRERNSDLQCHLAREGMVVELD